MSKPDKYPKQLSEAIETTRNELLEGLRAAQAKRTTALSTRNHAAHDKWSACKEMRRSEQVLAVASRIEEMATRTQLLAGNLTQFANDSHNDSEQAQSAMAEAAAAIKNAANAMELLTEAVHAETAVTKSRDNGDDVNEDALVANAAMDSAMTAVEVLQNQSLKCSIIAATPLAGSVAQAFSVLGDQVGKLVTDTTQARDMARQEVAATTRLRDQTWESFYKTIEPFERPLQTQTALLNSLAEIDKPANFGLTVKVSNPLPAPAAAEQGLSAGLLAQVSLPVATVDFYTEPVFYAFKEQDVAALHSADHARCQIQQIKEAPQKEVQHERGVSTCKYTALLLQDYQGKPLKFGTTYRIFMKQDLKKDLPESALAHLARFSLPSQPVLSTYSLEKLIKPSVLRLFCGTSAGPTDPLLVAFTLPAPPPKGVSYRMIIIPKKLWESRQEDEQYLIERASPSDYAELAFGIPANESAQSIQQSILGQFGKDIQALLPSGDHEAPLAAATAQVAGLLSGPAAVPLDRTALVYYSCVPTSDEFKVAKFGYYSDMSGDVINLSTDQYVVGVLAWQDNPDGPYVGALVGKSDTLGTPPRCGIDG